MLGRIVRLQSTKWQLKTKTKLIIRREEERREEKRTVEQKHMLSNKFKVNATKCPIARFAFFITSTNFLQNF